jgi:hypothetical protein
MGVDPADWKRALAGVTGKFVRGQHRVTSRELLIEHLAATLTDKNVKRLRPIMRELGWNGPQMIRFGKKTQNGYWRPPTVGGVFSPDLDDAETFAVGVPAVAEVRNPSSTCLISRRQDLPSASLPLRMETQAPRALDRIGTSGIAAAKARASNDAGTGEVGAGVAHSDEPC